MPAALFLRETMFPSEKQHRAKAGIPVVTLLSIPAPIAPEAPGPPAVPAAAPAR